jgi:hypothetical protein
MVASHGCNEREKMHHLYVGKLQVSMNRHPRCTECFRDRSDWNCEKGVETDLQTIVVNLQSHSSTHCLEAFVVKANELGLHPRMVRIPLIINGFARINPDNHETL